MSAPTITDPAQLNAAYQRTEQLLQEAVEAAEHAAFMRCQHAYGAYEIACDDAFGASNHGVSVYLGRCRYCAVPLLTIGSLSEDCRGGGQFLEVPGAKL